MTNLKGEAWIEAGGGQLHVLNVSGVIKEFFCIF